MFAIKGWFYSKHVAGFAQPNGEASNFIQIAAVMML